MLSFEKNIADILISGGVGVIPTDTIYGIVGRADMKDAVERVYAVRKRSPDKPCIILISSFDDLKKFNIEVPDEIKTIVATHVLWPGKVSIIFPCSEDRFEYLSRGTKSLAFRMPNIPELRELLSQTGPLIAPSANIEGEPSAHTIESARLSFKDLVDFYVDDGTLDSLPSTLIKFEGGKVIVLREGAVKGI